MLTFPLKLSMEADGKGEAPTEKRLKKVRLQNDHLRKPMWGQIPFRGICVEVPKPSLPEFGAPCRDEVE